MMSCSNIILNYECIYAYMIKNSYICIYINIDCSYCASGSNHPIWLHQGMHLGIVLFYSIITPKNV